MKKNSSLPRGLRNNNPLNIRLSATRWNGMCDVQDDKQFCQFKSMRWGWRAAFLLLYSYYTKHGLKTIRGIISRWAPPADNNNTEAYIKRVADYMLVEPDKQLPSPQDYPLIWIWLAQGMCTVENGQLQRDFREIYYGWALAAYERKWLFD